MDKSDMIKIVKKQLAIDLNCKESDFDSGEIVVTEIAKNEGRIMYEDHEQGMYACCFGGSAVFSVMPELVEKIRSILGGKSPEWIFQPNTLVQLSEQLYLHGYNINDMHQYYVPDPSLPKTEPLFDVEWIESDFEKYRDEPCAKEALGFDKDAPDVLAVAAKENGKIIGMAGASADSPLLWQIGITVAPEYRGKGVAANLVALLKDAVLERGKVPYYGSAVSHTLSLSTGVAAGFFPCWTRISTRAIDDEFVGLHNN